jgi:hypothetical protein
MFSDSFVESRNRDWFSAAQDLLEPCTYFTRKSGKVK